MWFLGHIALGYFSGVIVNHYTKEKIIIPLLWVAALLPDLDFLVRGLLIHRGPTHSILVATALFLPIYLLTKHGLPYFAALATHTLIGDYFENSEKLFWPLSNRMFGAPHYLQLTVTTETILGLTLFVLMIITILSRFFIQRRADQTQKMP
jgi:membrane-bound metal-dependent hydrolase YbcI (DUF457 family)